MMKVPQDIDNKVSFTLRKRRYHFVEYTSSAKTANNEVVITECAVVYVVQGRKEIIVDGKLYSINAGELFMLPKGKYVMSEYMPNEGEFKSIMIFFNHHHIVDILNTVGQELALMRKNNNDTVHIFIAKERVMYLFKSFKYIDWDDDNGFGKELLDIKIKELMYILLSDMSTRKSILIFLHNVCSSSKKSLALVVNENIYDRVSLCVLAAKCNMSVSTFKREFAKEFKTSPIQWISNKRLEKSLLLLKNTTISISDIAYECGFENYIHFARRFRAKYGKSANSFRSEES